MDIKAALNFAVRRLVEYQKPTGEWCFELEADCTIPSEYILMMHFIGEVNKSLQQKLVNYIVSHRNKDGGWPLFIDGPSDLSCSVKSYYALKLSGYHDTTFMSDVKDWIIAQGGAAKSNVFTRIMLAQFGQIPWRGIPWIPVELILFPKWFPFHIDKIAYWSRCVLIPLTLLYTNRVQAQSPVVSCSELFVIPPDKEKHYFGHVKGRVGHCVLLLERFGYHFEKFIPKFVRKKAKARAWQWILPRLNGVDGLGAIFPAMVNAYLALRYCYPWGNDSQLIQRARESIDRLLIIEGDYAYCQPCVSPVWDTALSTLALQEYLKSVDGPANYALLHCNIMHSCMWIASKQIRTLVGDWERHTLGTTPGGWAFQYNNAYYPDVDDTAVCAIALYQYGRIYNLPVKVAFNWIQAMCSTNGGYGAFDKDNCHYYLNEIPFADHGALLDPPTADVTARCVTFMAITQSVTNTDTINFLLREQEEDGSWIGRWGTNKLWGTWSVITALHAVGTSPTHPSMIQAHQWIIHHQNEDGGWGESNLSYHDKNEHPESTAFHTALALLTLCELNESNTIPATRAVEWLLAHQQVDGLWEDKGHNAPGFPRVFYLKYHGYAKYFPIWALAKYYNIEYD